MHDHENRDFLSTVYLSNLQQSCFNEDEMILKKINKQ